MTKFVREDGKVAVLISPGFGAGWSTWDHHEDEREENICFDAEVVQWVLDGKPNAGEFMNATEERLKTYCGGMRDLTIEWVYPDSKFRIEEYDGSESIHFEDQTEWITA